MLNDNKSITTATVELSVPLSEYRKKFKFVSLLLFIIGLIGVVAYIVLSTLYDIKYGKDPVWVKLLLISAVPFTLGLIGFITVVRLNKRAAQAKDFANCVFYGDCFFYNVENKSSLKFVYADAVLKSENENYGYIYVFSKGEFAVFSKEDLSETEINTIRKKFGKNTDGETVELENYKKEEKE